MQGIIKTYLPTKHYGFIKGDDGRDYFFHVQDLLNSRDVVKLCEAVRMQFAAVTTEKGDRAKALVLENASVPVDTYVPPEKFLTSSAAQIEGWTVLEHSDWLVHGTSRGDPANARREAISHAQAIGANGLLDLEYFTTTGSEQGTGSGIHHFTIHHYRGRAVVFGRRHAHGQPRLALVGVNAQADSYLQSRDNQEQQERARTRWWAAAALGVLVLLVFTDGPLQSLAPLFGLVAGAVFFTRWYQHRFDFKNAGENIPLLHAPWEEGSRKGRGATQASVRRSKHANRHGVRSFVVDEAKLAAAIQERHTPLPNAAASGASLFDDFRSDNTDLNAYQWTDDSASGFTANVDGTPMFGDWDIKGNAYGVADAD